MGMDDGAQARCCEPARPQHLVAQVQRAPGPHEARNSRHQSSLCSTPHCPGLQLTDIRRSHPGTSRCIGCSWACFCTGTWPGQHRISARSRMPQVTAHGDLATPEREAEARRCSRAARTPHRVLRRGSSCARANFESLSLPASLSAETSPAPIPASWRISSRVVVRGERGRGGEAPRNEWRSDPTLVKGFRTLRDF